MADQPPIQPGADHAGVPDDVQALILRYFDNDLDDAGLAQLREALKQSTAARELFVRWAMHGELLTESLSADYKEEAEDLWQDSPTVLAELAQLEQQAQASLVEMHHLRQPWYTHPWAIGLGSLAAVIALAVVLTFVFVGNDSLPTQPAFTNNTPPNKPAESAPPILRDQPVATLTATHNAQWAGSPAEGASARGSDLHAGQKLTLTAGFAEITTKRGAVAVLQAPCTIELIDTNELRLKSGKLVGICQTQSAKGFVVRAPHMDIIDLGTRFGVDASGPDSTEAHVLEGEIEVTRRSSPDGPVAVEQLGAGQAVRATHNSQGLTRIRSIAPVFVTAMPDRFLPEGTGFGLEPGDTDPNWRVVAIDGQPITEGGQMRVVYPGFGDAASSQWLLVSKTIQPDDDSDRTVTCRGSFQLPPGFDAQASQLVLGFNADFVVEGIRVNGKAIDVPENKLNREAPLTEVLIQSHAVPGINTIEFDIYDRDSHSALNAAFEVRPLSP